MQNLRPFSQRADESAACLLALDVILTKALRCGGVRSWTSTN